MWNSWKIELWRWQWCWWHRYVGDFMMVTVYRCWWQNHNACDFFRYIGDFLNVLNRSPTSQTCHQHILSPISVTNIDITQISSKLSVCNIHSFVNGKFNSLIHYSRMKVNMFDWVWLVYEWCRSPNKVE